MTVWSIGSPSGFTGRLFHTITCAQSRRDSHTANHIMCGVWNRQWGDPLGDKPGHQASRYLPWWKWHQKQNMTWDFIISTSGIQGDFWYINHGCRQDNSWKNQLVTNFFHLHYKILSNALGLTSEISGLLTFLPLWNCLDYGTLIWFLWHCVRGESGWWLLIAWAYLCANWHHDISNVSINTPSAVRFREISSAILNDAIKWYGITWDKLGRKQV